MKLSELKEGQLAQIKSNLYKRGSHQGRVVHMQLVYPVPKRTTVRPMSEDDEAMQPSTRTLNAYNDAYWAREPGVAK